MKKYAYQGAKLRECRKLLGISGSAAGAAIGVGQSSYSKWEQGAQEVPLKHREALAQALNTTWAYISLGKGADESDEPHYLNALHSPQPLATDFAFQCGQMLANIHTMAAQWDANPHLLDGLRAEHQNRLTRIFEAAL